MKYWGKIEEQQFQQLAPIAHKYRLELLRILIWIHGDTGISDDNHVLVSNLLAEMLELTKQKPERVAA